MMSVSGVGKLVTNRLSPAIRATPIGSSASQPANPPGPPTPASVVAADDVVEAGSGVGFHLLPAVTVDDDLDGESDQLLVDHHVVVSADRVVLVECPVETG